MDSARFCTTCPTRDELGRAVAALQALGIEYRRIDPTPPLARVAVPALVLTGEARARLEEESPCLILSGWVEHREAAVTMPAGLEPAEEGLCFGRAAIMVLQPCVAEEMMIRLTAHLSGDLGPVLPYLNAVIQQASFTPAAPTLTLMEGRRMIVLHPRRITIAKAEEIVDAWLILERFRRLAEETWANRARIEPCFETRKRPPALEIFKRLPQTNCGRCGEATCLAFAARLWAGRASLGNCRPLFEEDGNSRREALVEILSGLGMPGTDEDPANLHAGR